MKTMNQISLLAFLLICGFGIKYSTGQMQMSNFRAFIEDKCYHPSEQDEELVYGQEHPLAQTLETFLYLTEKYELANPSKSLREVTVMLLRNYTIENLRNKRGDFGYFTQSGSRPTEVLWGDVLSDERQSDDEVNPYEENEICSLYSMLAHTVNDTAWPIEPSYAYTNNGADDRSMKADDKAFKSDEPERKTRFPREQGVVGIGMTNHAVALGRVISGIYLGLARDKLTKTLISLVNNGDRNGLPKERNEDKVDLFYVLTTGDMLALATWDLLTPESKQMGGNGAWISVHKPTATNGDRTNTQVDTTDICPNVYKLGENATSYYTYSLLRGAVDGVILGNLVNDDNDLANVRLSQLLRMYYTKKGIPPSNPTQNQRSTAFCNRVQLIGEYSTAIQNEVDNSVYIVSDAYAPNKVQNRIVKAKANFEKLMNDNVLSHDLTSICSNGADPQTLPCETPSDVIAVLDTSDKFFLNNQQVILGYLANYLRLWHQGSKMTVLLDQRNGTNGLGLEELLPEMSCSPCVACNVTQQQIEDRTEVQEKDFIIQSLDKFLQQKKDSESTLNGVAGKVVIYFNFAENEQSTPRLDKALIDLRLRHHDTAFFAVGKDKDVLLKYARYNQENTMFGSEGDLKDLAKRLAYKTCISPAALQYADCQSPKEESRFYYQGFVTPSTIQHWSMNPKYFLKSYSAKITFDVTEAMSQNIQVCSNRASAPESAPKANCKETNSTSRRLEFVHKNPCKGFDEITCGAMTFSIIGLESKNGQNGLRDRTLCQDKDETRCKTLDQIAFKVSHEGIRCNGCSSLTSMASILTTAYLFYFILTRNAQY